jgi:ascorbate-specific PTS system EIIC-type component UlaA
MKLLVLFLRVWFSAVVATFVPLLSIAFLVSVFTDIRFLQVTSHGTFWIAAVLIMILMLVLFGTAEEDNL